MSLPTDATRCGKDRIATGQLHFHYCHLDRGHGDQHECMCGARFWTLHEEAAMNPEGQGPNN